MVAVSISVSDLKSADASINHSAVVLSSSSSDGSISVACFIHLAE